MKAMSLARVQLKEKTIHIAVTPCSFKRPNQPMEPTTPWRRIFSVFAANPARGLSLSR
jgi:hypothetical protein